MSYAFSKKVFLLFGLLLVSLSGCSDGEGAFSPGTMVEQVAEAKVFNNDPSPYGLRDAYEATTLEELIEGVEQGDPHAEYLLSLAYLNGVTGFDAQRDQDKGRELLERAWRQGVVDAGYGLYYIYYHGQGVRRNRDLALAYLEASAEGGYIRSQRLLARAYWGRELQGNYDIDMGRAIEWYTRAAEQGDQESAAALAEIYETGDGVEKDEEAAFYWMKQSVELEYGTAVFSYGDLAEFYEEGIGTNVDLVQAYKFHDLQGAAGSEGKSRLAPQMTQEQLDEAIRLSYEWQAERRVWVPNSDGYRHYR